MAPPGKVDRRVSASWQLGLTVEGAPPGVLQLTLSTETPAFGNSIWLDVEFPKAAVENMDDRRAYVILPFDEEEDRRRLLEWLDAVRMMVEGRRL